MKKLKESYFRFMTLSELVWLKENLYSLLEDPSEDDREAINKSIKEEHYMMNQINNEINKRIFIDE